MGQLTRIAVVPCYSTLDISASSKNGTHSKILWTTWTTTSLSFIKLAVVIGIINSFEQFNSSPSDFILMKAMNAATKMHVAHHEISDIM